MRILNEEGQAFQIEFERDHKDGGCTCFIIAPCDYCVHPGHPLSLEGSDDLWIDVPYQPAVTKVLNENKSSEWRMKWRWL